MLIGSTASESSQVEETHTTEQEHVTSSDLLVTPVHEIINGKIEY